MCERQRTLLSSGSEASPFYNWSSSFIFTILHTLFSLLEFLLLFLPSESFGSKFLYYCLFSLPRQAGLSIYSVPVLWCPVTPAAYCIVLVIGLLYDFSADQEPHSRDLAFSLIFSSSAT